MLLAKALYRHTPPQGLAMVINQNPGSLPQTHPCGRRLLGATALKINIPHSLMSQPTNYRSQHSVQSVSRTASKLAAVFTYPPQSSHTSGQVVWCRAKCCLFLFHMSACIPGAGHLRQRREYIPQPHSQCKVFTSLREALLAVAQRVCAGCAAVTLGEG